MPCISYRLADVDRSLTFFISEQTMVNHAAEASQLISSLQYLVYACCVYGSGRAALSQRPSVINITNGPPSDKQNKCCSIYWLLLAAFWYRVVPITCTRSPLSWYMGQPPAQLLLGDWAEAVWRLCNDFDVLWMIVCAHGALDILLCFYTRRFVYLSNFFIRLTQYYFPTQQKMNIK